MSFLGGLSCSLSWFCFTQWRSICGFLIVLAYLWTWRERCWLQTATDSCSASVCVEMWWVLMFLILPTVNKQPEIRSPGSFIHALSLAGTTRGRVHVVFSGCVQAPEWGSDRVDWSLDLVSVIGVESWSDPLPRTNLPWEDPAGQEALSISGGHNAAKILSKWYNSTVLDVYV